MTTTNPFLLAQLEGFDPATMTAQGQLNSMFANNGGPVNGLMDRARKSGQQQAQSRGLLNSSMAAQAGQNAVLDFAAPLATTDAGIYSQFGLQQAANTQLTELERIRFRNQMKLNEQGFGFDTSLADQEFRNTLGLQQDNNTFLGGLEQARFTYQQQLQSQAEQQQQLILGLEQEFAAAQAGRDFGYQQQLQAQLTAAQERLADINNTAAMSMNRNDNDTRSSIASGDRDAQLTIAAQQNALGLAGLENNRVLQAMQNQSAVQLENIRAANSLQQIDAQTRGELAVQGVRNDADLARLQAQIASQERISTDANQTQRDLNTQNIAANQDTQRQGDIAQAFGAFGATTSAQAQNAQTRIDAILNNQNLSNQERFNQISAIQVGQQRDYDTSAAILRAFDANASIPPFQPVNYGYLIGGGGGGANQPVQLPQGPVSQGPLITGGIASVNDFGPAFANATGQNLSTLFPTMSTAGRQALGIIPSSTPTPAAPSANPFTGVNFGYANMAGTGLNNPNAAGTQLAATPALSRQHL